MTRRPALGALLVVALSAAPVAAQEQARLLGAWLCVDGACPDEQIAFTIEDGAPLYRSWLHDRPAVIDGRWTLDQRKLVIEYSDLREEFELLRVTRRSLRLREPGGEEATLRRLD